jgi:hypothetical protein
LFTGRRYFPRFSRNYDFFPDGQRFVVVKPPERGADVSSRTHLDLVLNWFEELKRLVPTD